ncbi:MAG TPA: shufflon system plasmid conjugative transfer pilus tip adhesin PilV [Longimicrobium sp.]|nr:shufflon system plasmid conjugative transfer pilus tip adhesin PilV [Longimicrobium sp.]
MSGVGVVISKKTGNAVGTVIATIGDPENRVVDVSFYVTVMTATPVETGPYPPDIVHRPAVGIYEKDVLLAAEFPTEVRVEVRAEDATPGAATGATTLVPGLATQTLPVRTAPNTGGGTATGAYLPLAGGTVSGAINVAATLNWAHDIPDGSGQVIVRSAADARKRSVLGYSDGGAGMGFGFLASGQLGVRWTPLALQPSGGEVMIGGRGAVPASALHVYGEQHATFGPNTTWGAFLKVGSGPRPDTSASIFATNGNLHVDSQNGTTLFLQYYTGSSVTVGSTPAAPYKFNVYGDAYVTGAARIGGNSPLFFEQWGGGWFMSDATFLRAYGNKGIATGGAVRGGDLAAESGAHALWGGARLYNSNEWGATPHPTVGSTGNGGIIMLRRPHIPFHPGGAFVRGATDAAASAHWDTGVYPGDNWVVARMGNPHLTGFNNGTFRFHYHVQAGDTGLNYPGSMSATNRFRSIGATGWYNETYGGGWYMEDTSYVRSYNNKSVYTGGRFYAGAGFQVEGTQGLLFDNGASLHALTSYVIPRSDHGIRVEDRLGSKRGHLYFDTDGFGLVNSVDQWAVRINPGSVALHGSVSTTGTLTVAGAANFASAVQVQGEITDAAGNRIPATIVSPRAPLDTDAAALGTIWYVTGA